MESVEYLSSNQTLEKAKSGEPSERQDSVGADDEGIEEEDGREKEMTPSPKSKSNDSTKYSSGSMLTDEWHSEITSPPVKRRKREQKKTATGKRKRLYNIELISLKCLVSSHFV